MKNIIYIASAVLALTFLSCQDTNENTKKLAESPIAFHKNIGEQIPMSLALRWRNYYLKQGTTDSRTAKSFSVSNTALNLAIQSVPDATGLALHYALDETGHLHLLLIPVDETLDLWPTASTRKIIDAGTMVEVNPADARALTQNYINANPSAIRFHFFGINTFNQINAIPYFTTLDIEPAINDTDLTPQLLLFVWDNTSEADGRSALTGVVFDKSNPCPPYCAISEN